MGGWDGRGEGKEREGEEKLKGRYASIEMNGEDQEEGRDEEGKGKGREEEIGVF